MNKPKAGTAVPSNEKESRRMFGKISSMFYAPLVAKSGGAFPEIKVSMVISLLSARSEDWAVFGGLGFGADYTHP